MLVSVATNEVIEFYVVDHLGLWFDLWRWILIVDAVCIFCLNRVLFAQTSRTFFSSRLHL